MSVNAEIIYPGPGKTELKVIRSLPREKLSGNVIGGIVCSRYYVYEDSLVSEVVDDLLKVEDISAMAVVNRGREILGFVSRKELFDMIGKNFGRELYASRKVIDFVTSVKSFHVTRNIFSIAEDLDSEIHEDRDLFFILHNDAGEFAGIFSTRDILLHLSDMMKEDLATAKRLQSFIVKDEINIERGAFLISGASVMARGVGGDFYSVREYDRGKWYFSICDVSGKGMSAALLSSIIGGMESIYDFRRGVKPFVLRLNEYIYNSFKSERFITGIFLDFDENTGALKLYDAGHSYFYIYRGGKIIVNSSASRSVPLGITDEFSIKGINVRLQKDDLVILITDGIEEQTNTSGQEFGIKRFIKIVKEEKCPMEIKERLFRELYAYRKNQIQKDDMTLMFLKYKG